MPNVQFYVHMYYKVGTRSQTVWDLHYSQRYSQASGTPVFVVTAQVITGVCAWSVMMMMMMNILICVAGITHYMDTKDTRFKISHQYLSVYTDQLILDSANYVAAVQCIKTCHYRSRIHPTVDGWMSMFGKSLLTVCSDSWLECCSPSTSMCCAFWDALLCNMVLKSACFRCCSF